MNYVNTAHDAVKYCTNTPKEYKSPWIKCLLIYIFLGMYWELHGLGSSRMGPCRRISIILWNSVQIPQNGMTDTEYFFALIILTVFYLTQNGLIFFSYIALAISSAQIGSSECLSKKYCKYWSWYNATKILQNGGSCRKLYLYLTIFYFFLPIK